MFNQQLLKRHILIVILIAALVAGMASVANASTKSVKKDKKQLKEVQKQKDDISDELNSYKKKIKQSKKQLKILKRSVSKKSSQIKKTQKELERTKKNISIRRNGLNNRLRTMYKSGSIGYLDVILGSNSIEELVTNVDLVQKIYKQDQTILTDLKAQKKEIEKQEKALKKQQAVLKSEQQKETETKASLDATKSKLQSKLNTLTKTENKLKQKIADAIAAGGVSYAGGKWSFPIRTSYVQTSHFGEARSYENHPGIDLAVPSGTKVYAAQSGKVTVAGVYGGYGNAVFIYHGGNMTSIYGHNSSLVVSNGQYVKRGQLIAYSGNTGWSSGPHVHFEVRNGSTPVSPQPYIGIG